MIKQLLYYIYIIKQHIIYIIYRLYCTSFQQQVPIGFLENIGTIHKHIIHNLSSKTIGDITHSKKIIRKLAVKMYYVLICFFIIAKVEKLSK